MKTALILEDTPRGLKARLVWQDSGHQDHLPDSITMHLMAFLVRHIEQQDQKAYEEGWERIFRPKPKEEPVKQHQ